MELVDHERLESVRKRIDIIHPAAPTQHVIDGDNETSEDDETENENSGRYHGLRECS